MDRMVLDKTVTMTITATHTTVVATGLVTADAIHTAVQAPAGVTVRRVTIQVAITAGAVNTRVVTAVVAGMATHRVILRRQNVVGKIARVVQAVATILKMITAADLHTTVATIMVAVDHMVIQAATAAGVATVGVMNQTKTTVMILTITVMVDAILMAIQADTLTILTATGKVVTAVHRGAATTATRANTTAATVTTTVMIITHRAVAGKTTGKSQIYNKETGFNPVSLFCNIQYHLMI